METLIKTVLFIFIISTLICLLPSCSKEDFPKPLYTSTVLLSKEEPPEKIKIIMKLVLPKEEGSLLSYALSPTQDTIYSKRTIEKTDIENPLNYSFTDEVKKCLSMSREDYSKAFGTACTGAEIYRDRALYFIDVPDDTKYNDEKVTYAGQNVIIDYHNGKANIVCYTLSGLGYEKTFQLNERIGDKYYFKYGYYDMTEKKFYPYTSETNPPYEGSTLGDSLNNSPEIFSTVKELAIKENKDLEVHFNDKDNFSSIQKKQLGDRLYILLGNARYASTLYYAIINTKEESILYLEEIKIDNCFCQAAFICEIDENGNVYTPYIDD